MNECFNGTDLETVNEEARGKSDGPPAPTAALGETRGRAIIKH